jgi:orotidine-5'-phosphate decarboxylase
MGAKSNNRRIKPSEAARAQVQNRSLGAVDGVSSGLTEIPPGHGVCAKRRLSLIPGVGILDSGNARHLGRENGMHKADVAKMIRELRIELAAVDRAIAQAQQSEWHPLHKSSAITLVTGGRNQGICSKGFCARSVV